MSGAPSSRGELAKRKSFLSAEEKEYTEGQIFRKRTVAEHEVLKRKDAAHEFISHLESGPEVRPYIPNLLENAIFCGHLVTDLDSIAGAIGAAELYGL